MIRMLVSFGISLAASTIGLIAAALILDDVSLDGAAFVVAVAIFTVTTAIMGPFIMKTAIRQAQALLGASALVTTFVGLVVTDLVSDGLSISGADTWLFATLIVWLAGLLAALLIPIILVKRGVANVRDNNGR